MSILSSLDKGVFHMTSYMRRIGKRKHRAGMAFLHGVIMVSENKLGLTVSAALAREEERLSKKRAAELYHSGYLDTLTPGTWATLAEIYRFFFADIYDFAGKMRTVNLTGRQDPSLL